MKKVLSYINWSAAVALALHALITNFIWHVNWILSIVLFIILFALSESIFQYIQKSLIKIHRNNFYSERMERKKHD
ncbi:unnamed protein product [Fructobacillus evanidus]|uniref:Uncharacterized protein n=1 Tax=Fructobacillus evanidus TaxID=3064281 RepID=A0ABN9YKC7_9LACO|nr:unnamed protein product [Fructobacillus sp. LMG 32999]CAK1221699.1 unnamed protein product [Fructobacillus sp. LMG 32999]CAK1225585.1 unnamed protein product [Fructobacillus sp. LMG 32999]CAK1228610.1 unnamed protein product [Fructobacillus sp. LMG 32999]CAK1228811.1 unnamed protein product [Fructobacillus sp. LMG 32999]